MKTEYDKESGIYFSTPDCVDEYLHDIWAIGFDYDGYNTVEGLKTVINELVKMSQEARKCLWNGELFGIFGSPDER